MRKPMAARSNRVIAFCDWLESIPPSPPFQTRPEFRFYEDLSDGEIDAAQIEMKRRAHAALAEARDLEAERSRRAAPAHRIVIRPEAFGPNIDVVIEPPLPGGESFDRDFPTHKAARGYAGGIRMTRGFPIVDLASDAALDDLLSGGSQ